jgi:hypothetical protein
LNFKTYIFFVGCCGWLSELSFASVLDLRTRLGFAISTASTVSGSIVFLAALVLGFFSGGTSSSFFLIEANALN